MVAPLPTYNPTCQRCQAPLAVNLADAGMNYCDVCVSEMVMDRLSELAESSETALATGDREDSFAQDEPLTEQPSFLPGVYSECILEQTPLFEGGMDRSPKRRPNNPEQRELFQ